jgi:hypothetical protein
MDAFLDAACVCPMLSPHRTCGFDGACQYACLRAMASINLDGVLLLRVCLGRQVDRLKAWRLNDRYESAN